MSYTFNRFGRRSGIATAAAALAVAVSIVAGCLKAPAPELPVPEAKEPSTPALSSIPPAEPTFTADEQGTADADREFFNEFSWRDFIALNWPAADSRRGAADVQKKFGDPAERVVWESWKSLDELFPDDPRNNTPTAWDSYKAVLNLRWLDRDKKKQYAAIPTGTATQDAGKLKLLQQVARLESAEQFLGPNIPIAPLIAQNRTYVRFETRVNQQAYEFVVRNKHYIRENQYTAGNTPKKLEFDPQSINIKAAWMELTNKQDQERFYYTKASIIVDWIGGQPKVEERVVGLVGLHIVHKTPGRKDWIWSTFEHVDNLLAELPPGPPGCASFSTKNPPASTGHNKPPRDQLTGPNPFPPPANRVPVEVVRSDNIHETTVKVNNRYQQHPQVKGTVWANYKLVGTQWPRKGLPTRDADGAIINANVLPPRLANVTMETYTSTISCLGCHAGAQPGEFVFYPQIRAVSVPPKNNP